jgi:hypothetical protein
VNDEKTDSNDVTSSYDDGETKNELVSGIWEVKKKYDAEPRLDEAESVSVDDKSTFKKIGTQENFSVQKITKPDEILADVVKTKDTDANNFGALRTPYSCSCRGLVSFLCLLDNLRILKLWQGASVCNFVMFIQLTTVLYLQPYCTYNHTVLTTILYLQPYCTYNRTVLTTVLYLQPYCIYNHTVLTTVLYLQPYCTYNCTVLTTILYLQPYCT